MPPRPVPVAEESRSILKRAEVPRTGRESATSRLPVISVSLM